MLGKYIIPDNKRIYVITHFDHPAEFTPKARKALDDFSKEGIKLYNQNPLIRGVNDNPEVLGNLFHQATIAGTTPYYVFICRPTRGNYAYAVPVEEAFKTLEKAKNKQEKIRNSGLDHTARLVMSHATGKVEVLSVHDGLTVLKYKRYKDKDNEGKIMHFASDPKAMWFDDYLNAGEVKATLSKK